MSILEIILLSIGLSMDAFAISICEGLSIKKIKIKDSIRLASYFAISHVVMLLIGYFLGISFESIVTSFDHWIAFVLLLLIGGNMIKEAFIGEDKMLTQNVNLKSMIGILFATTMDALAVGVSLAFLQVNITLTVVIVGVIVALFSLFGLIVGSKFSKKYGNNAKFIGGVILILMGIKTLLEHLGLL